MQSAAAPADYFHMARRLVPFVLGAAFLAAVPAGAQAKVVRTAVLGIDSAHHLVRTVDIRQNEVAYRYRGNLPRQARPGSLVRLVTVGHGIKRLKVTGHTSSISFAGHIKALSSGGVSILTADHRPWVATRKMLGGAATAAATATLKVGEAVFVSLKFQGRVPHATVVSDAGFTGSGSDPSSTGSCADPNDPTADPTTDPTADPTADPSTDPTADPTTDPTADPTADPAADPNADPPDPADDPSDDPSDPPC